MAQILLTGATGFVGDALLPALVNDGHSLVCFTRNRTKAAKRFATLAASIRWITSVTEVEVMPNAVINLSGEGIADSRWTETRKRVLRSSRITVTEQLVAQLNTLDGEPDVVVSGSAIGYYGPQTDAVTEEQPPGSDFSARLCADWEKAIDGLVVDATHIYTLRIGVVLGRPGGFLGRLETPVRFGLGGPLGDGQQMLSWIHRDDLVAMIRWMLSGSPEAGAYNATSPQPVSNEDFTKTFGDVLRRPTIFRVPETPMRLALGELADLLFKGQPVYPKRALDQGFQFEYPELKRALTTLFE
ncbi:MAG: TIGR01777 family oxidoreductase [Pseudomonadota bacterium]|nr:TIGR01777 family oxidoreductase [Pseudomonadota bacterium]